MIIDNLVVVESPAKAKTIEKILGKQYKVKSCYGHIRDLSKEKMGIDIDKNFAPKYVIAEDKKKIVAELRALSKQANTVWLATDEDREGEAISWHICEVLNLNSETTKRIVFHEITKPAIVKAIEHPRYIDMNLVNAQQARRLLDRIVGFKLSPVLIRKIPSARSLSAGRVQSVAVRLIVERERKIEKHTPFTYYGPLAQFITIDTQSNRQSTFTGHARQFKDLESTISFFESCIDARFVVEDIVVRLGSRNPASPFTTSTMQQDAVRKLGYSVSRVMLIAQKLYEEGLITYMRTDSTNLSKTATDSIEQYVTNKYGKEYHQYRQYVTKNKSVQEAHEAIRPTDINLKEVTNSSYQPLYDLIRKRTLASQMSEAKIKRTTVDISISNSDEKFKSKGEVITFDGYLKAYIEGRGRDDNDDERKDENADNQLLPQMQKGQPLDLITMQAKEKKSKSEVRYNEATLVKQMEALGIGRPSTYAPTIATILKRKYVEKKSMDGKQRSVTLLKLENGKIAQSLDKETYGTEKNRLFPTDLGIIVNDFLYEHFDQIMDYAFTAKLEEDFDSIASGNKIWTSIIEDFFSGFEDKVKSVEQNAERVSGERLLGEDAETKKPIKVRMGRYGPMVQLGETEDEEKPKFAKLLPHQQINTLTLEEACDLLSLPKEIGLYKALPMVLKLGPYGPYIFYNKKFYAVPKGEEDIFLIGEARGTEIIAAKDKIDANRLVQKFEKENIQILNGRYGVYIKTPDGNFKIPRAMQYKAKELTLGQVKKIITSPRKKGRGRIKKK